MSSSSFSTSSTSSYSRDHEAQKGSGVMIFTPEQKAKNLLLRDRVKDILPLDDIQKVSDCDLLYRFLIGKRWSVDATEAAIRTYAAQRKEQKLNYLMIEKYNSDVESSGAMLYGFDKEGCPIMWNTPDIPLVVSAIKNGYKTELLRVQMRVMETARFLSKEKKVDRCTLVLDLCNLGISAVNSMTLSFARDMAKIMQEYYPEIMRRMLIFNAGWAVTGAWKVLRPFVDPRVQEKMHFFSGSPTLELLLPFIDADQIPASRGGSSMNDIAGTLIASEVLRLTALREEETQRGESTPLNRYVDPQTPQMSSQKRSSCKTPILSGVVVLKSDEKLQREQGKGKDKEIRSQSRSQSQSLSQADFSLPVNESVLSQLVLEEKDEFFSVCSSISTDSEEEGTSPQLVQIGSPEVLASGQSHQDVMESYALRPQARVEKGEDQEKVVINLTECADGKILGFIDGVPIGEMEDNLVYRAVPDRIMDILAPCPVSSYPEERKLVGELLSESGHRIHNYVIVCDASRKARYLLKKSRLRRRVQVFTFSDNCKVFTDSLTRHTVVGRKVKFAECFPHSEATNDLTAWVMNGTSSNSSSMNNNTSNNNSSSKRLNNSGNGSNNGRSRSNTSVSVVPRLVEKKGQTLMVYGELAKLPIIDLFTLLVGVCRVWEADLRRPQEGGIQRAKNIFGARLAIPTTEMFRRLLPRSTPAPVMGEKEEENIH